MIKIAVAAARGIGDGLITLVLANNLARNGFEVTVYSNLISQLNNWFPSVTILPYPKRETLTETLSNFDLTLADAYSEITQNVASKDYPKLAERYVFFCMANFDRALVVDHSEKLRAFISDPKKLEKLLPLTKASGVVINRLDNDAAMIDRMAKFCKDILKLQDVTRENGILPPAKLTHKKYPKRIIIHPTSSNPVKNWPPHKFIALAKMLKTKGFEPVFTVSPAEHETWNTLIQLEFLLPYFPNLNMLAQFIYESGWMIGTDSGIGHLASNLGIPTITICRTGNRNFRWRPGWAPGKVIKTKHKLHFVGQQNWHWLVSVKKVLKVFKEMVGD